MTNVPAWQTLVYLIAVADALMLAVGLMVSKRMVATRARFLLSLFLIEVAVLLAIFAVLERQWFAPTPVLLLTERWVALLAPVTALHYVRRSMGARSASLWIYLPPAAFLLCAVVLGAAVLGYVELALVIAVQVAYTATATVFLWLARRKMVVWPIHLAWLVGGLWLLHMVQVARILWPQSGWLFDAVPLVGAAMLLGLTWRVLVDPRALRRMAPAPVSDDPLDPLKQLDAFMAKEKPFLDPGLDLARLAEALGMAPRQLSATLNGHPAGGFYNYVNQHRVAAACEVFRDPSEKRTSVEAVALMVGFRSRSTFYDAFAREIGMTPAAFRQSSGV